ncbi:MAG TPA: DUF3800 domain-containing protein [Armatimonadota bacterium]|nr:DUF3800 domain-containing protein [Armatimonadota bacterium]
MLLFYIDECGDHSLRVAPQSDPPQLKTGVSPWFVLGAVGIRDTSRQPLAAAIKAIKERHFGESVLLAPWAASEIKGRYLSRAARSVANGRTLESPAGYPVLDTVEKVDALIEDLGLLFTTFRPLVFAVGVNKKALLRRTDPVSPLGAAYAYLEQRVALTLQRVYQGEGAVLVADQQTQHEAYFRSGEMNETRDALTAKLPTRPQFDLVLDKPLWVDTDLSTWDREILQLADIVAYSVTECLVTGRPPQARSHLWAQIRHQLAIQWSTGAIEGGGLAIFPRPRKYPET